MIGQTLLKLALPRLIVRGVAIAVAVTLWFLAASWILDVGGRVNYEFLHSLSQPALDMIQKVNPYLWRVIVGIWTLIVCFILRAWLSVSLAAGRATPIGTDVLAGLAPQLSEESLGVLRWIWGAREDPFTVGDLRRSLSEIRHHRIGKIAIVAEQAKILDAAGAKPPRDTRDDSRCGSRAQRDIESRIGGPAR